MSDFGEEIMGIRLSPPRERDDFGTRASSLLPTIEIATELESSEQDRGDAIARIDAKLDAVVEALLGLQRRIDSIDAILARIVAG